VHDDEEFVFDALASVVELGMRVEELLYLSVLLLDFSAKIVYEFQVLLLLGLMLKDFVVELRYLLVSVLSC